MLRALENGGKCEGSKNPGRTDCELEASGGLGEDQSEEKKMNQRERKIKVF